MYRPAAWRAWSALVMLGASTACRTVPDGPGMEPLGTPGGLVDPQLPRVAAADVHSGTATLVGIIIDGPSALGVQRVGVHAFPLEAQGPVRGMLSDSVGSFRLDGLVPGVYEVRGRRIVTHRARSDTVRLRAGTVDTIELALVRYDSVALTCGVVSGSQRGPAT